MKKNRDNSLMGWARDLAIGALLGLVPFGIFLMGL